MVVRGVVRDNNHAPSGNLADPEQMFHKNKKGLAVEFPLFAGGYEFSVAQAHRPEIPNALARGVVQQNGVLYLGGHPHNTPRSVLLKVNLVDGPQVYAVVRHQRLEFFLCAS